MSDIDKTVEQITRLQAALDELEAAAMEDDNDITEEDEEFEAIQTARRKLLRLMDVLDRQVERSGMADGVDGPVRFASFDEDEATEVEGELGMERFSSSALAFRTSLLEWRNNCKTELIVLIEAMLDKGDDGPQVSRGPFLNLMKTALTLAGQPHIATAVDVMDNLFSIAENAYAKSLPRQPSVREAQVKWNKSLDEMCSDQNIDKCFAALVDAFKTAHGYDADVDVVYGSAINEWNTFIGSFSKSKILPSATSIKQQFMTVAYKAMPDQDTFIGQDFSSGLVTVKMEYDPDKKKFSVTGGDIDDLTPEVRAGLKNHPVYGKHVIGLPATIHFEVFGTSFFDQRVAFVARRASTESGSTSFRLDQRALSPMSLDEQQAAYDEFIKAKAYLVDISKVL
ncbi:MAG: hypothetical protein AAGA87_00260 [Pseudomonadota bacterium]